MRRHGVRFGRRNSGSGVPRMSMAQFIALTNPYSVLVASSYTVDGVSGNVASFDDLVLGGHKLVQATSGNQAAIPAANGAVGGQLTATMTNAGATFYDSNLAASSWKFLHDGTGVERATVLVPSTTSGTLLIDGTRSSGNPGVSHYLSGTTAGSAATNDSGGVIYNMTLAGTVAGQGIYLHTIWQDGIAPPEAQFFRKQAAGSTANPTPGTVSADPSFAYRIGVSNPTNWAWAGSFVWNRVMTTQERATFRLFMSQHYGLS